MTETAVEWTAMVANRHRFSPDTIETLANALLKVWTSPEVDPDIFRAYLRMAELAKEELAGAPKAFPAAALRHGCP
jgi:hypothetical protein